MVMSLLDWQPAASYDGALPGKSLRLCYQRLYSNKCFNPSIGGLWGRVYLRDHPNNSNDTLDTPLHYPLAYPSEIVERMFHKENRVLASCA